MNLICNLVTFAFGVIGWVIGSGDMTPPVAGGIDTRATNAIGCIAGDIIIMGIVVPAKSIQMDSLFVLSDPIAGKGVRGRIKESDTTFLVHRADIVRYHIVGRVREMDSTIIR